MAIQMRRGLLRNFDRSKTLPAEMAVTIDNDNSNRKAFMTFASGVVKEFAFRDDLNPYFFMDYETGHVKYGNTENYDFAIDNKGHLRFQAKGV